jgi:hypothetical protein
MDTPVPVTSAPVSTLLRVHEAFTGRGRVFAGSRALGDATFMLKAVDEICPDGETAGCGAPPAAIEHPHVYGLVRTARLGVLVDQVGARLTLQFEDGRALHFTVAKILAPTSYLVQGLGFVV